MSNFTTATKLPNNVQPIYEAELYEDCLEIASITGNDPSSYVDVFEGTLYYSMRRLSLSLSSPFIYILDWLVDNFNLNK